MIISLLLSEPILFFAWLAAIVIAITIHEFSHAAVANALGDPTAKNMGRLSINPLVHMDVWGTLLLLFARFGWGKPVPFNPYNLKSHRMGPALVAMAGPMANIIMVVIFGLILRFIYPVLGLTESNALFQFLFVLITLNAVLAIFNLIPVPPLDGSKLLFAFLPPSMENVKTYFTQYGFIIIIGLLFIDNFTGLAIFGTLYQVILDVVYKFVLG